MYKYTKTQMDKVMNVTKGQQYLACILRWSSQRKACLDFTDKDINWCVMLFHTLHFLMYVNISFWPTASRLCATVSLTMLSYFSLFFSACSVGLSDSQTFTAMSQFLLKKGLHMSFALKLSLCLPTGNCRPSL